MEIIKKKPDNGMHPAIPELQESLRNGKLSRREFLRLATLLGLSVGSATFLANCAPAPEATAPAAPAATVAPVATEVPKATITRGGQAHQRQPRSKSHPPGTVLMGVCIEPATPGSRIPNLHRSR